MSGNSTFPKHLKFAALVSKVQIKPLAFRSKEGKVTYFLNAHVIPLIQQALGFSYEMLSPEDNTFGAESPSGNWTGIFGMIQKGEADMAVSTIISEKRLKVVDFSFPYLFTDITFVTDKPEYVPKKFAIFYPFSFPIWIAIAFSLLSMSFLLYVFLRKQYTYTSVFYASFGILLENAMDIKMKTLPVRILSLSWIFGALFIAYSYKAVLLSFLSFPSMTGIYDIKDLSKAAKIPSFRCRTRPGSFLYNVLLNSSDELLGPIGNCIRRNLKDISLIEEYLDDPNTKKAFLKPRISLTQFQHTHFLSDDSFFYSYTGIAVDKAFCCKKTLDKVIIRLFDVGLLQKSEKDMDFFTSFVRSSFSSSKDSKSHHVLTLDDLFGAFLILIIGLLAATIVLIIEIVTYKRKVKKKTEQ